MKARKVFVYVLSLVLIVFGIAGSAFSIVFMQKITQFTGNVKQIETINTSLKSGFESITTITKNTGIATVNMAESIKSARLSLEAASGTASSSADAIYSIAKITDFDILGFKPMSETGQYFNKIGDDLKTLSASILDTAVALQTNEEDIARIGTNFEEMTVQLDVISGEISRTVSIVVQDNILNLINILTIYITVLHAMFILIGLSLMLVAK
jgi:predicted PurR-regulated permease PerM